MTNPSNGPSDHSPPRRVFLRTAARLLDGAVGLALAIPGLRFLAAPLLRREESSGDFLRVAPLDALPADRPLRVEVRSQRRDAYLRFPPDPIGRVWLLRESAAGEPRVRCWQTVCPHLGCGIEYAAEQNAFTCPCHASEFDVRGARRFGPSPRDMDELDVRLSPPDENSRRWVEIRFRSFQPGIAARKAIG